jgi:hypothetical protein
MRLIVWQSILEDEDLMGEGDLMDETHFASELLSAGCGFDSRPSIRQLITSRSSGCGPTCAEALDPAAGLAGC